MILAPLPDETVTMFVPYMALLMSPADLARDLGDYAGVLHGHDKGGPGPHRHPSWIPPFIGDHHEGL